MTDTAKMFYDIGEPFAAGFFELEGASPARMFCRAYRRFYENTPFSAYKKRDPLFPYKGLWCDSFAVNPQYCRQYYADYGALRAKSEECERIFREFDKLHGDFQSVPGREAGSRYAAYIDGWNHSVPNFKRIIAEGLDSYECRIREMKDADLREALLDLMDGIRTYHRRMLEHLEALNAEERLVTALKKVPFAPAETAYEAIVACNFALCLDGCDNIGFIDGWLPKYWRGEDLTRELASLMMHVAYSNGWSMSIGPEYSELTKQYLTALPDEARPMIELRVTPDMPDDIWEVALERVVSGGTQPAFYNENAIQSRLCERFPDSPREDIYEFAGMGCTETNFSGLTFSGGIDVNLNVLRVFDDVMRESLSDCDSFDALYERFISRLHSVQDDLMFFVNNYYNKRSEISFAPIRTLFTDDCIEREKGYYSGGARYTFAVPSDSGIPNTVDSLLVVKELVFEKKLYAPLELIEALDSQDPRFLSLARKCHTYGVADPVADSLIHDLTKRFYAHYRHGVLDIGDGFLPTAHQFIRHVEEGKVTRHTPDGRRAGTPLADSIAAASGKAVEGPTRMLISAASYDQSMIYAIPVLNLSLSTKCSPEILRALIEGYFKLGGTQVQITYADRETLIDAKKNPDAHEDLIVRVGGYSDFFNSLSSELRDAVIERIVFDG
ncbi:MAG: hypothetical protein IKM46_03355 [Clostridia bacterium]|nr:hypothetical protein [Clostridia bacterium]